MSLLLLPIFAQALSVNLADRTEIRTREDGLGQHLDLLETPRLELKAASYRTQWSLVYSPSISLFDLGSQATPPLLFQSLALNTNITISRRTSVYFNEYGMYGYQNFRALSVAPVNSTAPTGGPGGSTAAPGTGSTGAGPLAAQAGVQPSSLQFGLVSSTVGAGHRFAPRWRGNVSASYMYSGGLDAGSELYMPRSREFIETVSLVHSASTRDELGPQFNGLQGTTQPYAALTTATHSPTDALVVDGMMTWTRRIARNISGSVSGGVAYAAVTRDDETNRAILPVGGAYLEASKSMDGWRSTASISETYAPFIDRLLGTISERAMTAVTVQSRKADLTLRVAAYSIVTTVHIGPVSLSNAWGADESIQYRLDRHFSLELGSRQALQSYQALPNDPTFAGGTQPLIWAFYSALVATTGDMKL